MEHARLELRLSGTPNGAKATVAGAIGGPVLGALVLPDGLRVTQTVLPARLARQRDLAASENDPGAILVSGVTPILMGKQRLPFKARRLWVDQATGQITQIFIGHDGPFASATVERVVAAADIVALTSGGLVITTIPGGAAALPIFRDDAAIAGDVGGALEQTLLDPRARRAIHARVEDGKVEFSGVVDAQDAIVDLLAAARRVPGVRGVRSDIIVTELLADQCAEVIDALRAKGDLGAAEIEVRSEHQIVYLNGHVPSPKARDAVERAVLGVAGVRLVVNELSLDVADTAAPPADPASPRTKLK